MPRFPDSAPSSHSLSDSVCGKLVERSTPEGNENGKLLLFGRLAFLLSLGAVGGGDFGDDWIPAGLEELVGFLLDERHPAAFGHPANLGALPCGPWWPRFLAGKYGSALDLDGAAQYAMLPAGLLACVTNFTIAVWVNWDGGAAWQRIFDFGNDTKQNMFLILSSGRGTLRFAITTNGAGAEQILEAAALPPGQWQHVAITRDGKCVPPLQERCPRRVGRCDDNARQLQPGAKLSRRNPVCADPLFGGRLDELFIYNYALSGNEIARLAANEPPVLGGLQIPGDGNQDSSLDISDAVRLLGFLFGASSPPALGTACILIEGCQDRCAP